MSGVNAVRSGKGASRRTAGGQLATALVHLAEGAAETLDIREQVVQMQQPVTVSPHQGVRGSLGERRIAAARVDDRSELCVGNLFHDRYIESPFGQAAVANSRARTILRPFQSPPQDSATPMTSPDHLGTRNARRAGQPLLSMQTVVRVP